LKSILAAWPVDRPRDWARWVDEPQTAAETEAIRQCIRRSRPFGDAKWTLRTAERLNLDWTMHPRGRPPMRREGARKELRPL
jgi:putative transposase